MTWLEMLAAFGLWPALPVTGRWLLNRAPAGTEGLPALTAYALAGAVGLAVWSVPLLAAIATGIYDPHAFGLAGWGVVLAGVIRLSRGGSWRSVAPPRPHPWDVALTGGLGAAGFTYLAFPTEHVLLHDMASYVSAAGQLALRGGLHAPFPWPESATSLFHDAFVPLRALDTGASGLSLAYFGKVFPAWLAQAFSTFGPAGLLRLNGVLALVSLAVYYGLCRTLAPKGYAVAATLLLALNPSQIWLARIALTEILTQLCILSGLLLLLLALRDGRAPAARWAGLLLGLSTAVHVDALFLFPLLFLAHLAMRLVEDPGKHSTGIWLALYQTAIPTVALSVLYYVLFSWPYIVGHARQVLAIGAVAAACLSALIVLGAPPAVRLVRPVATGGPALVVVSALIVCLSAYAYWIRPYARPFVLYQPPHPPGRAYVENSLIDLAAYLSPLAVWGAILGWVVTLWGAVRKARAPYLVAALVLVAGFAALYLWNRMISPAHFYAIRRFVPLIIPGFVLFAALGAWWLALRLPRRLARMLATAAVLYLVVFTARADSTIFAFADHGGTFGQLRELAHRLPRDEVVLADWSSPNTKLFTVLHTVFDRPVTPLDLTTRRGEEAFRQWVRRQVGRGEPVYLLSAAEDPNLHGLRYETVMEHTRTRSYVRGAIEPLPNEIITGESTLRLYRITGVRDDVDYRSRDLLQTDGVLWGIHESGFHERELYQGREVRWTDGSARLVVPTQEGSAPGLLQIYALPPPRDGTEVRVRINGRTLYQGPIRGGEGVGWWTGRFRVAGIPIRDEMTIEILSDTAIQTYTAQGASRTRTVGVPIGGIGLLDSRD